MWSLPFASCLIKWTGLEYMICVLMRNPTRAIFTVFSAQPSMSDSLMPCPKSKDNFGPIGKGYSSSHFWCIMDVLFVHLWCICSLIQFCLLGLRETSVCGSLLPNFAVGQLPHFLLFSYFYSPDIQCTTVSFVHDNSITRKSYLLLLSII